MKIREYKVSDLDDIIKLFYDTVHNINIRDYSQKQIDAWAPKKIDIKRWSKFLETNYSIVAIIDNKIVGFGDIEAGGYLNTLYVHKDFQNKGIGNNVVNELERFAKLNNIVNITTEASITARPFFEKLGYKVVEEQNKFHNGVYFTNYIMNK